MPYIGLLPFLQTRKIFIELINAVSMPYIGLLPFLLVPNCDLETKLNVSMPYIGLLPFLQRLIMMNLGEIKRVNALHQASPISTILAEYNGKEVGCVNALHRASPISTS